MRLPHHLVRSTSGVFHFRLKVPADLRAAIGRIIIKQSLRTRDPKLAQVCSYALSVRYAQAFAEHREQAVPKPPPPPIKDILASNDEGRVRRYDLAIDPATRSIHLKTDGTRQDHADGMVALENIGKLFPHMFASAPPAETAAPSSSKRAVSTMTLHEAIDKYTQSESPVLKKNTWTQRQRAFKSFEAALGPSTPVAIITRMMAGEWAEKLIAAGMTKRTTGNQVSHVAQLFKMLGQRGVLGEDPRNPVKGVVVFTKKEKNNRREQGHAIEALPLETLKRVFAPENFQRIGTEHGRWAAVMGLYTGARVGELAQLFLKDFDVLDGTPCVRITVDSDGQTLKTDASRRLVPLHPDLLRLGLWERVERLRQEGHDRFFPDMRIDSKAGAGNSISKAFRYFLHTQMGVKPQRANGTVSFHSLRKNVIQELQGSKLLAERRRSFVGHEPGDDDVHEADYMRKWTAGELAELFPGLRWGEWLKLKELGGLLP